MSTRLVINFANEDGSSGPGNGEVGNADFLPDVGDLIILNGTKGIIRKRVFVFSLDGKHGVFLDVEREK